MQGIRMLTMTTQTHAPRSKAARAAAPRFEVHPELPPGRWIKLKHAVQFALFGGVLLVSGKNRQRIVVLNRAATRAKRGALLCAKDPLQFDRIIGEFEDRLFDGGESGKLRLRGTEMDPLSEDQGYPRKRILGDYFQHARGID
jgi:hypothetical protein